MQHPPEAIFDGPQWWRVIERKPMGADGNQRAATSFRLAPGALVGQPISHFIPNAGSSLLPPCRWAGQHTRAVLGVIGRNYD